MDRYDVIVIGGGPIGAVAAREAAKAGARTLLVERRREMKGPIACTGLIGPRTLSTLGASAGCVLREIRAVVGHAPDGSRLSLRADEVKGLVIDRRILEAELLAQARSAGVEVLLGTEATVTEKGEVTLAFTAEKDRVEAEVIIGADGPRSKIARGSGLTPSSPPFSAAQAEIEATPEEEDRVEVYFGRTVAPGFFAWSVPAEEDRIRVGLAVPAGTNPQPFLERLLAERFPTGRVLSRVFGLIPSCPTDRSVADRVILVGDAAGQVKPLTGGGLYTGGICASIAGRTAARAALSGRGDRAILAEYEVEWLNEIGSEIRFGLAARETLLPLDDSGVNAVFAALDDPELLRFIAKTGDIDRPSLLISALIHRPWLWERILPVVGIIDERKRAMAVIESFGRGARTSYNLIDNGEAERQEGESDS